MSWAGWWNTEIKVNPTQVSAHLGHPVHPSNAPRCYSCRSDSSGLHSSLWPHGHRSLCRFNVVCRFNVACLRNAQRPRATVIGVYAVLITIAILPEVGGGHDEVHVKVGVVVLLEVGRGDDEAGGQVRLLGQPVGQLVQLLLVAHLGVG